MTARRIIDNHIELENIGTLTHDEIDSAITGSSFITISGHSALSGSRVLTAGSNISIVDNGPGNTLIISSTGGSGGTGLRPFVFGSPFGVPSSVGTRYLNINEVPSSVIPLYVQTNFVIKNAYIAVDTQDASRNFNLKVLVSSSLGQYTGSVPLNSGSTFSAGLNLNLTGSTNGYIQLFVERTVGTGKSDFNFINAAIELV